MRRLGEIVTARRPYKAHLFPKGITQREAAVSWLRTNHHTWRGRIIERHNPMNVSRYWRMICEGLKGSGIYSTSSNDWDLRIDDLVNLVKLIESNPSPDEKAFPNGFGSGIDPLARKPNAVYPV